MALLHSILLTSEVAIHSTHHTALPSLYVTGSTPFDLHPKQIDGLIEINKCGVLQNRETLESRIKGLGWSNGVEILLHTCKAYLDFTIQWTFVVLMYFGEP